MADKGNWAFLLKSLFPKAKGLLLSMLVQWKIYHFCHPNDVYCSFYSINRLWNGLIYLSTRIMSPPLGTNHVSSFIFQWKWLQWKRAQKWRGTVIHCLSSILSHFTTAGFSTVLLKHSKSIDLVLNHLGQSNFPFTPIAWTEWQGIPCYIYASVEGGLKWARCFALPDKSKGSPYVFIQIIFGMLQL